MKWIPCKQQHPPVGVQVLAYGTEPMGELVGGANMEICIWDGDRWWNEGGTELYWSDKLHWTHWMPLPSPP